MLCDKSLLRLFLFHLYLKTTVAFGMIRMLSFADRITELSLYSVRLSNRSIYRLSKWLESTFSNESQRCPLLLDLGANNMPDKASEFIARILRQSVRVKGVNLAKNVRIRDKSIRRWLGNLAFNDYFQTLGLLGVPVSEKALQAMDLLCARTTSLACISLSPEDCDPARLEDVSLSLIHRINAYPCFPWWRAR